MRIAGGEFRGRVLAAPKGMETRPTTDKIRQAVFNMLQSRGATEDARVLDVFCGTGALGLEALSRGAAHCLFVDNGRPALAALRKNIAALGVEARCAVKGRDGLKLGPCPAANQKATLVFLDPPYRKGLIEAALPVLVTGDWLEKGAWAVLECEKVTLPILPVGFAEDNRRTYGDTQIIIARYHS